MHANPAVPWIFIFQFSVKKRTRNLKVDVNSHCKGHLEVRIRPRLKFYRFGTSEWATIQWKFIFRQMYAKDYGSYISGLQYIYY